MVRKKWNKLQRFIRIIIVISLFFTSLHSFSLADTNHDNPQIQTIILPPESILDQKQEHTNDKDNIHSVIWMAQSFKPLRTPLTKVEVKLEKLRKIESPIEIAIRDNLTDLDIISYGLPGESIPYYSNWIEFDIADIDVVVNQTYYIILRTNSPAGESFSWFDVYDENIDYYPRGEQWFSNDYGSSWMRTSGRYNVDFTFRTYSYESHADLSCNGSFDWKGIKPGETITGSFTIQNSGTPFSQLSWDIYNWPSWGTWTFNPSSGENLNPEDGMVTVIVTVEAPHSNIPDTYEGEIYIINKDNPDDYCLIRATMQTPNPKNNDYFNFNSFSDFVQSYLQRLIR